MKKRLLICGTKENNDEMLKNFSSEIIIVGYTDCKFCFKDYVQYDSYLYKPIVQYVQELFDYVVITYRNEKKIEKALEEFDVIKEKCIVYEWFKDATIINPFRKFEHSKLNFEQIILGMSHSQVAIQTQLLNNLTYKFSLPSMDMFCHYQLYNKLKVESKKMQKVNRIILELPYYIFNYDLSKSVRSVKKRLFYFKLFNCFHNYGKTQEEKDTIRQFYNYMCIFKTVNPELASNNTDEYEIKKDLKSIVISVFDQINVVRQKQKVWSVFREETIEENIHIFNMLISDIRRDFPETSIEILVCPFNPLFRIINRRDICKMRKLFYSIMKENQVKVYDNFSKEHNPFCFNDHCHLKSTVAREYTNYVKETYKW